MRALSVLLLSVLLGCSDPEPIRLGLIAGISGRVADLGTDCRNGATLAIEEQNNRNGIKGRPLQLLLRDDQQQIPLATRHIKELSEQRVSAIIGPCTSQMTLAVLPTANEKGILLMGGTVTSDELSGQDDQFFRTVASTRTHASRIADYVYRQGVRRVAALYDTRNRAYTLSWLQDFTQAFEPLGGDVISHVSFSSSDDLVFAPLARTLLQDQPDAIALVSNSVDAALMAQQIRLLNTQVQLIGSEWSGTEQLIALGGRAVDGYIVGQYFDRNSQSADFLAFDRRYRQRFSQAPGYGSVVTYNATRILLQALERQREGEPLKQTLLRLGPYAGVQSKIAFDPFGDSQSRTFITEVTHGIFQVVE